MSFDIAILHFMQSFQPDWLTAIMSFISKIGSVYGYLFIVPVVVGYLYFRTPYRFTSAFIILINAGNILNPLLKNLVGRERPSEAIAHVLERETDPSFPSGHALSAFIFYGFLLYLVLSLPVKYKGVWAFCLITIILLIGISRVYLGAHWPSDVLGGYIIGAVWLAFAIYLYRRLKTRFPKYV